MNASRRLSTIEGRLGIGRTAGPQQVCPRCHGSGWDDNEARMLVELPRRMNRVSAQLAADAGRPPPTSILPDYNEATDGPLPAAVPCHRCAATGRRSVAAVEADERRALAAGEVTTRMMLATAASLREQNLIGR